MDVSRRLAYFALALFALTGCSHSPVKEERSAKAVKSETLVIGYVHARRGSLEPCGCSLGPLGGFKREWNLKAGMKIPPGARLVYLTGGGTFVPDTGPLSKKDRKYYAEKAQYILEGLNALMTSALSPSIEDLALGMDTVRSLEAKAKFPFLSANLVDKSGKLLFKPYLEMGNGPVTLLFVGLTRPSTRGYKPIPGVTVRPAVQALREVLTSLPPKPRLIVLISSLEDKERDAVLEAFPNVQAVAGGGQKDEESTDVEPLPNGGIFFHPFDRGKSVAFETVQIRDTSPPEISVQESAVTLLGPDYEKPENPMGGLLDRWKAKVRELAVKGSF